MKTNDYFIKKIDCKKKTLYKYKYYTLIIIVSIFFTD